MKASSFAILFGSIFSFLTFAGDILDSNKELYKSANNGDIKAMQILSRYYINQYSPRWNPERSRYWACRIYKLEQTVSTELNCEALLKTGEEKAYNEFIESGQKIKNVTLSANVMDNLELKVPLEKEWHIQWRNSECKGVCSYEIAIDGYFYIGSNKNYLLGRDSTLSLNGESGEIWVTSGSIITLQLDSKLVKITEYAK